MLGIGTSCARLRSRWAWIFAAVVVIFAVQSIPAQVFAQSGTWTATAGSTALWSGSANWSGGVVADGSGNTATFRNAGTTTVDSNRTIGTISSGSGARAIDGTGTLTLATAAGTPTLNGTVASGTLSISAVIAGTQGFQKNGTSTLALQGSNTFSGAALLQTGTTIITNVTALGASGVGNETVISSGAMLQIATGASPATIAERFSIAGRGNGTSSGGAIRILASAVTLTGDIRFTADAEITPNSSSDLTLAGSISGTGGFYLRASGAYNVTGNMSQVGFLNRVSGGSGVVTLSGSNSYTGSTSVDNGQVTLNNPYAIPTTSCLSVTAGGTLDLNGNDITIPSFGWRQDNNTNVIGNSNGGVITDSSATPGTTTIAVTSGTFVLGTAINDGGNGRKLALNVAGANLSRIELTGNVASTFSGGLTILTGPGNGTRLKLEDAIVNKVSNGNLQSSPLGTGTVTVGLAPTDKAQFYMGLGTFTSGSGSTILNDFVFNTAAGTDTAAGVLLNATEAIFAGKLVAGQASASFATGGIVPDSNAVLTGRVTSASASGGLWLRGNGVTPGITVRLANQTGTANDYQGPTTIDANTTLALGAANQIPNGAGKGDVSVAGSLKLGGFSETINGLSGSGSVDGGSGTPTLTVGDGDASATFSGVISNTAGALSLVKIGSGVQTLSGSNTYAGPTAVNAGKLLVNGDQSGATGAVTVAGGATLGGSGTIGGAVAVNGILSPGNSPGVLTVASLILGGSSTSLFEINTTTVGTGYDRLTISGTGGPTYGGTLSLAFGNGSAFTGGTIFDLFVFTGSSTGNFARVTSTGFYTGEWIFADDVWSLESGGQTLAFTQSTGDLLITVPEPSTLVLLSGVAVAKLIRRRRR